MLGFTWSAAAHIRLDSPAPRSMGSEVGPCGDAGTVRGDTPTVFEGGQEITVTWTEVIDHPSHYRIALLLDGEAFPEPTSQSDLCDPDVDSWCIADGLADESGSMTSYSHTFTLPNVDCDNCTLQVVQNTFVRYFQCADITIVAQADDPDAGAGGTGGSAAGGSTGGGPDGSGVGGGGGIGPGTDPDPATGGSGEPSDLEDGSGAPDGGTSGESAGCALGGQPSSGASWMLLLPVLWAWRRGAARATPRG